jgi:nucleolar protein 58
MIFDRLGRYKLKFSPDKVDTMIVQAISLLDDIDKELNNYVMRCKEWYGWHFPELTKIVPDSTAYVRTILLMGMKSNAVDTDFSDVLPEDLEAKVKEAAEVSMGSEISEEDLLNIRALAQNVLELQEYRAHLFEYLKKRMMAIAPNLTILVGEVVGARLISHAGSLIGLAKHPSSTVQILGAEKALFRALKARHDTPKYGLIYHAQLVGQSNPKIKGKMSRMLAAKASLATRVDALGDDPGNELGIEHRARLETRLRFLEEGGIRRISGTGKGKATQDKYQHKSNVLPYKPASDSTIPVTSTSEPETPSSKKDKKKKKRQSSEAMEETPEVTAAEEPTEVEQEVSESKKKKKGKKRKAEEEEAVEEEPVVEENQEEQMEATPSKKKKKKGKRMSE